MKSYQNYSKWTIQLAEKHIIGFNNITSKQQNELLEYLNTKFPPEVYFKQIEQKKQALAAREESKKILQGANQLFPQFIVHKDCSSDFSELSGCALLFTAGGEGERLRLSLITKGIPAEKLKDFTKATFPLPGLAEELGTLQINLRIAASICRSYNLSLPVIVSTGPEGSVTSEVIPKILERNGNFGLKNLIVIKQNERLHLSADDKIAITILDDKARPVVNPDETGGPLMKLKEKIPLCDYTPIQWLEKLGCKKLILIQATALYDPQLIGLMATAAKSHDGLGVGVLRQTFPNDDPFGTFAVIEKNGSRSLYILEPAVRNEVTRNLRDSSGKYFLPSNTGFYVFDISLIANCDLPFYATPDKEVLPGLPRAPKIGFAATDILPLAKRPAVFVIEPEMFGVLKNADDLEKLSALAKHFRLDKPYSGFNS